MEPSTAQQLRCGECGAEADDAATGWRAYIVATEEREHEFDGPDVAALFCPDCAEQEFDDG